MYRDGYPETEMGTSTRSRWASMSAREIVAHLREFYAIDVSPDMISAAADAVLDEMSIW
jgi:transposase-like protein